MDQNATIEEGEGRNALELVKSVSDKHLDLLRPSARYYSMFKDREKGKYTLVRSEDDSQLGIYDKPLPCFGCGIGWFSFLLGFLCPLMWYYATILYFGNYYRKDPRERAGLAASAIAVSFCIYNVLVTIKDILGVWSVHKRPSEVSVLHKETKKLEAMGCSVILLIVVLILLF